MKTTLGVVLGVLVIVSILVTPQAQACPCNCAALKACYASCKDIMPTPALVMFCDSGCLIACLSHSDS